MLAVVAFCAFPLNILISFCTYFICHSSRAQKLWSSKIISFQVHQFVVILWFSRYFIRTEIYLHLLQTYSWFLIIFTIEASNATSHAFDIDSIDYIKACSKTFNCSINKNIPQFNTHKAKWPLIIILSHARPRRTSLFALFL